VERGDHRNAERIEEVENVRTVRAAPDPELVLDRDDVDAAGQGTRRARVIRALIAANPMVDLGRIGQVLPIEVEGDDLTIAGRRREVLGERRDATVAGRVGGGECGACDDGLLSDRIRWRLPVSGGDAGQSR
jgi:hypothetical protein